MITGYNKPKGLPSFLQVKFILILKPKVLYQASKLEMQDLKLIQDNLKEFYY